MLGTGFIFGMVLVAVGGYFLYKQKKDSNKGDWLWVGHGDDPFKK
ncbi:MAG: hypothetical protein U9R08_05040 [Nanoarchaeota archaeon]|nr:hypothetical protein [Nanoarchaeota archaeon]